MKPKFYDPFKGFMVIFTGMSSTTFNSRIIAGTMTWGSWGKQLSQKQMIALLENCVTAGITVFDHADIYGNYENETEFGNAFRESGIPRESVQLISKCGIQMTSGRTNAVKHYQYDTGYIIWSAEQTLKKLRTDYLDFYLLHRPSPLMEPEEIAAAIDKLKSEGKVKKFGVSNFTASQIRMLEACIPVQGNQVEFSLTQTSAMEDGTFDDCILNKRAVMSWSPLGAYFREKTAQTKRIQSVMEQLKAKYDADESQLLLAFILKHPAHVYPVVGTANTERLKASLAAKEIQLALEDWFLLLEAAKGTEVP